MGIDGPGNSFDLQYLGTATSRIFKCRKNRKEGRGLFGGEGRDAREEGGVNSMASRERLMRMRESRIDDK